MSDWTYVFGLVSVSSPGRTTAEARYILETVLEHQPLVSGSEGDMKVSFTESFYGDMLKYRDEFNRKILRTQYKGFYETEYSSKVVVKNNFNIIIEGELRDRELSQTYRELVRWLCRLAKRLLVSDVSIKCCDNDKMLLLSDPQPFSEMSEVPSWNSKSGGIAWWEYLFWEPDPFSDMPLKLAWKYWNDPRIDAEMQRRLEWAEQMRQKKEQQESGHE